MTAFRVNTSERTTSDRAQSTVEFALVLPVLLLVSLGIGQVGLIIHTKLAVTHGAREAARALSVDREADANAIVELTVPVRADELWIEVTREPVSTGGTLVVVTVGSPIPRIAGFGPSLGSVESRVAMLDETASGMP